MMDAEKAVLRENECLRDALGETIGNMRCQAEMLHRLIERAEAVFAEATSQRSDEPVGANS